MISSLTITEDNPLIFLVKSDPADSVRIHVRLVPQRSRNEIRTLYVPRGFDFASLLAELDPSRDYPDSIFRHKNKPIGSQKLIHTFSTSPGEPIYLYLLRNGPPRPPNLCRVVVRGTTVYPDSAQLLACGFDRNLVQTALETTNGNVRDAAEYCLTDPRSRYEPDLISDKELFEKVADVIRGSDELQNALDTSKELLIYDGDRPVLFLNNPRWIRYQEKMPIARSPAPDRPRPAPPRAASARPIGPELSAFRDVLVALNSKGMVSSDLPELIRGGAGFVEAVTTYMRCGRDVNRARKALDDQRRAKP
jgi:hypothetical protein